MSKGQFETAKALIDRKQYAEARAILKTIDHPTAREWEANIDKRDPPMQPMETEKVIPPPIGLPPEKPPNNTRRFNLNLGCLIILVILGILYIIWPNKPLAPADSLKTATSSPTVKPSETATLTPTATKTLTITPSLTATITHTPMPTATFTPSPTPTITPVFTAIDRVTYYSVSTVNLRSCPSTTCYMIENLPADSAVLVTGMIEGEALEEGNPNWYEIEQSGQTQYAYSKYFTLVKPTAAETTAEATEPVQSGSATAQKTLSPVPKPSSTP